MRISIKPLLPIIMAGGLIGGTTACASDTQAGTGNNKTVTVVDDQVGCPTFTIDLARQLRMLAVARFPGVFHVSNEGSLSWCDFARTIFEAAGHKPDRIIAIPSQPAP